MSTMLVLVVSHGSGAARATVLAGQLRASNPGAGVLILHARDRLAELESADGTRHRVGQPDPLRWADLTLGLGVERAAWAVLPWVVENLADSGVWPPGTDLVVMDETFGVFGSLDALCGHPAPIAARARHLDAHAGPWGGHLPGLLVVSEATSIATWWKERVLDAVRDPDLPAGDQPWWDLPHGTRTITDAGLCLSAETAHEMEDRSNLEGAGSARLVDFTGLDPLRPWWYVDRSGSPVPLDEHPVLRDLCETQARLWVESGWEESAPRPVVVAGVPATDELRASYRSMLAGASDGERPANPFVSGQVEAFLEDLAAAGDIGGSGINRHIDQLLERRGDISAAFPHPRWRDRGRLERWLWGHGLSENEASLLTLPDPPGPSPEMVGGDARRPFGVNLVGYLGAELGLGVAARRLKQALDAAGVPNTTVSYDRTSSRQRTTSAGDASAPYHFNLLLITPDQLPLFVDDVGPGFLAGHHNIGLWYWECDVVAPQQEAAFDLVDEIWVATEYLTRAFSGHGKPVRVVPSPLVFDRPAPDALDRSRLGLDGRFTYLFSFDFLSEPERKNPAGVAEAYRRAFPEQGDTALLLKSINGHIFPEALEHLRWEVADREDIVVRDEFLPARDRMALVAVADCYVSLHRSEGLGLTMAEAMAVGTPVIATGYSGNLDFMSEESALVVPAPEVVVGPGHYYPAHGHWAEPDLDAAAEMMRSVRSDPALRRQLTSAAAAELSRFGYAEVGGIALEALLEAW